MPPAPLVSILKALKAAPETDLRLSRRVRNRLIHFLSTVLRLHARFGLD